MRRMRSGTASPVRPKAACGRGVGLRSGSTAEPGSDATATAVAAALAELAPDGPLGIALSGGGDSAALLALTVDWASRQGRAIAAATVDHRLRPDARTEAEAAGRLAARLGVPHAILTWEEGPGPGNLMAQARDARIRLLSAWAQAHGLAAVLTGHTLDDQAETVLMRLARGSGVDGLAGIPAAQRHGDTLFLRPLLSQRRSDLRQVLCAKGLGWIEDPTNADPRFDRVRMRQALAVLAPLGIGAAGLAETAERLAGQRAVLESVAADLLATARRWGGAGEARLSLGLLCDAAPDTRFRALSDTLQRIGGGDYRPRQAALERMYQQIAASGAGTLAGCCFQAKTGELAIWREPSAAAPAVSQGAEVVWDGRWRLRFTGTWPRAVVGRLGERGLTALAACPDWGAPRAWAVAPRGARAAAPAVFAEDELLAAPHGRFRSPSLPDSAGLSLEDLAGSVLLAL